MPREHMPSREPDMNCKLVVVGDEGCGKTCLLIAYVENHFPEACVPKVFENYVTTVSFEGTPVKLALWDTIDEGEHDRLRPLSYPDSHIILIAFSIDSPVSMANVLEKWYPEVAHFCRGIPVLLVGTKNDLRADEQTQEMLSAQSQTTIAFEQGGEVARKIGARYMECSAKTGKGVQEVFDAALKQRMKWRGMPRCTKGLYSKGRCIIL